jgi:NACHT domain
MSPMHLRIFLSSPGDVRNERAMALALIKDQLPVAPFLKGRVTLDVFSWDDPNAPTPTPAHLTPQEAINNGMPKPSECDIVIVILWSRMGTPLATETYRKNDGTAYSSGTEWEFEDALKSAKKTDGTPTILVYRCTKVPTLPITLSNEEMGESRRQWGRLEKFFQQFRRPDGSLAGGTHEYGTAEEFCHLLSYHLQATIRELLERNRRKEIASEHEPAGPEVEAYRERVQKSFKDLHWLSNPLTIFATTPTKGRVEARNYLKSWAEADGPRCVVLVGEFGSGKTGLLRWLAAELSSGQTQQFPIFVSLAEVRQSLPQSVDDLARLASPTLSKALLVHAVQNLRVFALLDGLDEVMDPTDPKLSQHRPVIDALGGVIPKTSRILLTCRSMYYQAIAPDLSVLDETHPDDRTDAAITAALEGHFPKPEILSLCDVSIEEGENYLSRGLSSNVWPDVKKQFDLTEFLRSPFTLRLLERALPSLLATTGAIDLNQLYEAAMHSMLLRDSRVPREGLENILQALALFSLTGNIADRTWTNAALSCGILSLDEHDTLRFQHKSLAEFFFARALTAQIAAFDASILARLDLIGGYNICRFLVPRLRTSFDIAASALDNFEARWLTHGEFKRFCDQTGWRRGVGYGYHPYRSGVDAPPYSSKAGLQLETKGFDRSASEAVPATRISWFDALQYCRWSGQKMLAETSPAGRIKAPDGKLRYCWAANWYDERRAYISALEFDASGHLSGSIGVNPDYRSESIGLALVTT